MHLPPGLLLYAFTNKATIQPTVLVFVCESLKDNFNFTPAGRERSEAHFSMKQEQNERQKNWACLFSSVDVAVCRHFAGFIARDGSNGGITILDAQNWTQSRVWPGASYCARGLFGDGRWVFIKARSLCFAQTTHSPSSPSTSMFHVFLDRWKRENFRLTTIPNVNAHITKHKKSTTRSILNSFGSKIGESTAWIFWRAAGTVKLSLTPGCPGDV